MTVVLSCFTFIYICKKEVRHWIIKTDFLFLSQQLLWPTIIAISCHQFSFSKRGQSSNISPLKFIFISKGFALRLVLRQKLEWTRKWPIRITYLTYYLVINDFGFLRIWRIKQIEKAVIHRGRRPRWITPSEMCLILHILRKPNSLIALLFIQNNS